MSGKPLSAKDWNIIFRIITGFNLLCTMLFIIVPFILLSAITSGTTENFALHLAYKIFLSPLTLLVAFLITIAARLLYSSAHPGTTRKNAPGPYSWALYSIIIFAIVEVLAWAVFVVAFLE